MRLRHDLFVACVAGLFATLPGAARAVVFDAEVTLRFEDGQLPPFELTKVGVAPVTAPGGSLQSVGVPALAGTDITTFPPPSPISQIELHAALPAGPLAAAGGPGNALPVSGLLRFVIASVPPPDGLLDLPLNTAGGAAVGAGGMWTFVPPRSTDVKFSFTAAPWTLGTAMALSQSLSSSATVAVTRTGFAHGPLSNTSTVAQAGGVIQFVTPLQVTQTLGTSSFKTASFATLQIRLLPEPGTGVVLATGAAALCALGRRRVRKASAAGYCSKQ